MRPGPDRPSTSLEANLPDHAQATAKDLSAAGDVRALPVGLDVLINNAAAYVDWTETAASA